jgi:hypothetical protein
MAADPNSADDWGDTTARATFWLTMLAAALFIAAVFLFIL